MKYTPDYKLQKAKKLINNLDDSENNELIKYYIQKKEEDMKTLHNRISEYQKIFDMIGKFIPHKQPRTYN